MKRDRFALGYLITAGFGPVIVLVVALIIATVACTPKQNFDAWIARQPITVKAEAVPCNDPHFTCGSLGAYDATHKVIYLDPARIAPIQALQDQIDPSVSVLQMLFYHEWSHAADVAVGLVEGGTGLGLEHAAQCGMQLVTGRAYTFFNDPFVYWICPDAELARTRWIWTAKGII